MSYCLECGQRIPQNVFEYSTNNFGIPLCRFHQDWVMDMVDMTTDENFVLYFALKERNVPAIIEKYDGYKHIDIAIPEAKVNIEVDGAHHNYNHKQALADLKRTYASFLRGYLTLRIPNSLVQNKLEETADCIVDFLNTNHERIYSQNWKYKRNRNHKL